MSYYELNKQNYFKTLKYAENWWNTPNKFKPTL